MFAKFLSFLRFKSQKVSSAVAIKGGYSHGRYDANPNIPAKYYEK
jgi:hypothetical protein